MTFRECRVKTPQVHVFIVYGNEGIRYLWAGAIIEAMNKRRGSSSAFARGRRHKAVHHSTVDKRSRTKLRGKGSGRSAKASRKLGLLGRLWVSLRRFLILFSIGWFLTAGAVGWFYVHYSRELPDISGLATYAPSQATILYSRDGQPLTEIYSENRKLVPFSDIPPSLQEAILAIEDHRFYNHPGVSPWSVARAMYRNLRSRRIREGASTITMQLARELFLTRQRTFERKLREMVLAVLIERQYSKQRILEMYMNQFYFGDGAFGVQAAAKVYYGKDVVDLELHESAMLAGLLQRPSSLSPRKNPKGCLERRNLVLAKMAEYGHISTDEAVKVSEIPIMTGVGVRIRKKRSDMVAHHFGAYAIRELDKLLRDLEIGSEMVPKDGLRVYTTLDLGMQAAAEEVIREKIKEESWRGIDQMALTCLDVRTGRIRAMVGGTKYLVNDDGEQELNEFNRVTQAWRPPGSSFKIYVYLAALQLGIKPYSIWDDSQVTFPGVDEEDEWTPKNYDEEYDREMSLTDALATSNNVIAVKLCDAVGVDEVITMARRLGIRFPKNPIEAKQALALGPIGIRLIDHTAAFASLANYGVKITPTAITKITDTRGRVLHRHEPPTRQVLSRELTERMLQLLVNVVDNGTGRRARIPGVQVAGKTGTSNEARNVLFLGTTPSLACGVWVGRDDNKPLEEKTTGGGVAAPIFQAFMEHAVESLPRDDDTQFVFENISSHSQLIPSSPDDRNEPRVTRRICSESGLLATEACILVHPEEMRKSSVPQERCDLHPAFSLDVPLREAGN